jgi:GT2 family glycosyltransferase
MAEANGSQVSALSGLVSIVVPCCGQLEYTKMCVPSLLRHSRQPFELIFIDIGSLDGTAEYLAGVAAAAHVHVEVVRTETDLGISEAVRTALGLAKGEHLALLNNDSIVTESWLNQLIGLANMSPAIGMVGPMSNYAAPPQLVEVVPYRIFDFGFSILDCNSRIDGVQPAIPPSTFSPATGVRSTVGSGWRWSGWVGSVCS